MKLNNFSFRFTFENGLQYTITSKVKLAMKRMCRPLTKPPNTVLTKVKLNHSTSREEITYNYFYQQHILIFLFFYPYLYELM